jgi:hypothetical protein
LIVVVVPTGLASKPRFRSDQTSWFTAPVITAIRGAWSMGSVSSGTACETILRKSTPLSRPAVASFTRVARSAAKRTEPAGSMPPV